MQAGQVSSRAWRCVLVGDEVMSEPDDVLFCPSSGGLHVIIKSSTRQLSSLHLKFTECSGSNWRSVAKIKILFIKIGLCHPKEVKMAWVNVKFEESVPNLGQNKEISWHHSAVIQRLDDEECLYITNAMLDKTCNPYPAHELLEHSWSSHFS